MTKMKIYKLIASVLVLILALVPAAPLTAMAATPAQSEYNTVAISDYVDLQDGLHRQVNEVWVSTEAELVDAVNSVPVCTAFWPIPPPVSIILANDIQLTNTLQILDGRHIALSGDHALIGADGMDTIRVSYSRLIIDGITITRTPGQWGRGIEVLGGSTLTMRDGVIENNSSFEGGGVLLRNTPLGDPWYRQASFHMSGGTIRNNSGHFGGGVHVSAGTLFIIEGGTISNNSANDGGGVFVGGTTDNTSTTFGILGGTIKNNSAKLSGGGIFAEVNNHAITFRIMNSTIKNNIAGRYGGGVASFDRFLPIADSTITNNHAMYGGGIFASNNTSLWLGWNSIVSGNIATNDGGGIWFGYSQYDNISHLNIDALVIFSDNQASRALDRSPDHDELYYASIHATQWTYPFTQGFNNFDIRYTQICIPDPKGIITRLAVGSHEGIIDQQAATITFHIPENEIVNDRFYDTITEFVADDTIAIFYVYGQEWPLQLGDSAGFYTGDTVFVAGGVVYTLVIIPIPNEGRIHQLTIGSHTGVVDQNIATITFHVPEDEIVNGRLSGIITELAADDNIAIFQVSGQEWPLQLGDYAGFSTGDTVFVANGIVYTLVIVPVSL